MKNKYAKRAEEILQDYPEPKGDMYIKDCIKAMCQLAEEIESNFINILLKTGLLYNSSSTMTEMYNEVKAILQGNLYTKKQVEDLLAEQRELCVEEGEDAMSMSYDSFPKNTVLNAKLKLDE